MSDIIEDAFKVARKAHVCDECGHQIQAGERYHRWAGRNDGEFTVWVSHSDCRDAAIKLNELHGTQYGDDYLGLRDLECDDREWLCEDFPAVAARVGWSIYDWPEPRLNHDAFFGRGSHYVWQVPQ